MLQRLLTQHSIGHRLLVRRRQKWVLPFSTNVPGGGSDNNNDTHRSSSSSMEGQNDPKLITSLDEPLDATANRRHEKLIGATNEPPEIVDAANHLILPADIDDWRPSKDDEDPNEQGRSITVDPKALQQRGNFHMPGAPTDWSSYEKATPLWHEMYNLIGMTGKPLSIAHYMDMCLTHPKLGYYVNAQVDRMDDDDTNDEDEDDTILTGDFVTSPEISNLFGECLGIWFSTLYKADIGPYQLLECGPGKGSLMVDVLNFLALLRKKKFVKQDFGQQLTMIHFVEASPALRQIQQEALETAKFNMDFTFSFNEPAPPSNPYNTTTPVAVWWHNNLQEFLVWQERNKSRLPTYAMAQEFLDALPVYSFEKTRLGQWRERLVDVAVDEEVGEIDEQRVVRPESPALAKQPQPRLRLVLAPSSTPALETLLKPQPDGTIPNDRAEPGSVVEVSPQSVLFIQDLAKVIELQGGAALIIDYGEIGSRDTIRGFTKHQQVSFLSRPGKIDITADVDFEALRRGVNNHNQKVKAYGPVTQGEFLMSMGIADRVVSLMERDDVNDAKANDLFHALMRLTSSKEMGKRYKVLAIAPTSEIPPPSFDRLSERPAETKTVDDNVETPAVTKTETDDKEK